MYYQKAQYNIPITIWLLETYPRQSPRVFVNPTQDMIIKHRHPFVDGSGMVNSVYIQHWVYPRSNLVELVQSLSLLFGQDPPLYSRPIAPVRPPPLVNTIHSGRNVQTSSSPGPSQSAQSPRLTYPPYRHDSQDQYKRNLVTSLTEMVRESVHKMMQERNNEMESIFHTQVSEYMYISILCLTA